MSAIESFHRPKGQSPREFMHAGRRCVVAKLYRDWCAWIDGNPSRGYFPTRKAAIAFAVRAIDAGKVAESLNGYGGVAK